MASCVNWRSRSPRTRVDRVGIPVNTDVSPEESLIVFTIVAWLGPGTVRAFWDAMWPGAHWLTRAERNCISEWTSRANYNWGCTAELHWGAKLPFAFQGRSELGATAGSDRQSISQEYTHPPGRTVAISTLFRNAFVARGWSKWASWQSSWVLDVSRTILVRF